MVAVERQKQNRQRMLAEGLKGMDLEESNGENVWAASHSYEYFVVSFSRFSYENNRYKCIAFVYAIKTSNLLT